MSAPQAPWELLGEIELEPPEEKRRCEACLMRRLCALFPTIAGHHWLCRRCRQLFAVSGYQLYLIERFSHD